MGAVYFADGYEAMNGFHNGTFESHSPCDTNGHGTHMTSTVAR